MATKPGSSFTWATDTNFSSGPASGQPTKVAIPTPSQGLVPGDDLIPEYLNNLFNFLSTYTDWVLDGSSAGGADAHIVETNASGHTQVVDFTCVQLTANDETNINGDLFVNGGASFEVANGSIEHGGNQHNLTINGAWRLHKLKLGTVDTNSPGASLRIVGQDANNTSGADNNSGGIIDRRPGRPSTNGGGAIGGWGCTKLSESGPSAAESDTGRYNLVGTVSVPGSGGAATLNTPPIFGTSRTCFVRVEATFRTASGTKTGFRREEFRVEVDGSGALTDTQIGSSVTDNNGFTGLPVFLGGVGSFLSPSSRMGLTVQSNGADSETVETTVHVEIIVGETA